MKKIISLILSLLMMTAFATSAAGAAVESNDYFDDGSFIAVGYGSPEQWESTDGAEESASHDIFSLVKRIVEFIKEFFSRFISKSGKPQSVAKTKYAAYYDKNGILLWIVYLTADFTFDGEKSECTDAHTSYEIKDSDWKLLSSECDKADNTATADFTVKQYKLGIPLKEIQKTLKLTCDEKGNIK